MLITDIINILGNEFSSIYCVNRQDQYIQIYRHLNENTELDELMNEKKTYETVIQKYIETNVFEEDRNKMLVATDFNNICKQLQLVSQFTIHYRIKNGNDILRYRMKCARIGNADTFEKIVFAFASEDSDIRLDELMNEKKTYETVIQKYIETNVFEEDRNKMLVATDFNNICKQLQLVSQFTIHYRIKNGNDILRYRMKCARIGNADTFEKIVFAFASEDSDIRLDELGIMNLSSTGEKRKSIFSLLIK